MMVKFQRPSARISVLLGAGMISIFGFSLALDAGAEYDDAAGQGAGLAEIVISFKLDPQLTRSLYMGDRWVSRAKYSTTVQTGGRVVVEARAVGKTRVGRTAAISPVWKISDCTIAEVSPARGSSVTIVATREGQCELTVSAGDISRAMTIDVVSKNAGMQLTVSQ